MTKTCGGDDTYFRYSRDHKEKIKICVVESFVIQIECIAST